jgi:hypothetical protein
MFRLSIVPAYHATTVVAGMSSGGHMVHGANNIENSSTYGYYSLFKPCSHIQDVASTKKMYRCLPWNSKASLSNTTFSIPSMHCADKPKADSKMHVSPPRLSAILSICNCLLVNSSRLTRGQKKKELKRGGFMSATAFIYFAIHRFDALTSIVATKTGEPAPKTSHNDTNPPHWSCSENILVTTFLSLCPQFPQVYDLSN